MREAVVNERHEPVIKPVWVPLNTIAGFTAKFSDILFEWNCIFKGLMFLVSHLLKHFVYGDSFVSVISSFIRHKVKRGCQGIIWPLDFPKTEKKIVFFKSLIE